MAAVYLILFNNLYVKMSVLHLLIILCPRDINYKFHLIIIIIKIKIEQYNCTL